MFLINTIKNKSQVFLKKIFFYLFFLFTLSYLYYLVYIIDKRNFV